MPTIREHTPDITSTPETPDSPIKLQVWVSQRSKRIVLAGLGDDGVYTFIIRHALNQAADFILKHGLQPYSESDRSRFIEFIRNRTDPYATREAPSHPHAGGTPGREHQIASIARKSSSSRQKRTGGKRKQDKEGGDESSTD